jgi:phosphatidylserine/phosphatidylglycerophosphate/cardiolipin synthase-like enzyme
MRDAPGRVAVYGVENHAGTPVYVHSKVCILDDVWASVGSDNFNRRSWTHDSELSAIVVDRAGPSGFARRLRLTLAAEHLDRDALDPGGDLEDPTVMADCVDPEGMFEAFEHSAAELDQWHDDGRVGPRPPGRLRRLRLPELSPLRRLVASAPYLALHDPDGRPMRLRAQDEY